MHYLVDHLLPDNCRTQLARACLRNNKEACEVLTMMRVDKSSIVTELKRDRRDCPRG